MNFIEAPLESLRSINSSWLLLFLVIAQPANASEPDYTGDGHRGPDSETSTETHLPDGSPDYEEWPLRTWTFPDVGPSLWTQTLGEEIGVEKPAAASLRVVPGEAQDYPLLVFLGGAWGGTGHDTKHADRVAGGLPFFRASLPLFMVDLEPMAEDQSNKWRRLFIDSGEGPNLWRNWQPMLERILSEPGIDKNARAIGGFSNGANAIVAILNDPEAGPQFAALFDTFILAEGGHRLEANQWLEGKHFLLINGSESALGAPELEKTEWLRPVAESLEAVGANVDYHVMPGVGHGFPEEEKAAVAAWLEALWAS